MVCLFLIHRKHSQEVKARLLFSSFEGLKGWSRRETDLSCLKRSHPCTPHLAPRNEWGFLHYLFQQPWGFYFVSFYQYWWMETWPWAALNLHTSTMCSCTNILSDVPKHGLVLMFYPSIVWPYISNLYFHSRLNRAYSWKRGESSRQILWNAKCDIWPPFRVNTQHYSNLTETYSS